MRLVQSRCAHCRREYVYQSMGETLSPGRSPSTQWCAGCHAAVRGALGAIPVAVGEFWAPVTDPATIALVRAKAREGTTLFGLPAREYVPGLIDLATGDAEQIDVVRLNRCVYHVHTWTRRETVEVLVKMQHDLETAIETEWIDYDDRSICC